MTKEAEGFTAKLIERLDYIEAHADEGGTGSLANLQELTGHIRALLRDRDAWKSDAISMQGQLHALRAAARLAPDAGRQPATIAELEAILNREDSRPVQIMPDGSVRDAPDAGLVEREAVRTAIIDGWTEGNQTYKKLDGMMKLRFDWATNAVLALLSTRTGAGEPVALTAKEAMDAGMKIAEDHALLVKAMHDQFSTDLTASLRGNKVWLAAQIMKAIQAAPSGRDPATIEIERLRDALEDIQREAMTMNPPRPTWYYDRAQNALKNTSEPLVRNGLAAPAVLTEDRR